MGVRIDSAISCIICVSIVPGNLVFVATVFLGSLKFFGLGGNLEHQRQERKTDIKKQLKEDFRKNISQ